MLLADQARVDSFTEFVAEIEPRLRRALTATFGIEAGRDATADALVYVSTREYRLCRLSSFTLPVRRPNSEICDAG